MSIKNEKFKVYEMTCTSCEDHVERAIKKLPGIIDAKANFSDESVEVKYDDKLSNEEKINSTIIKSGYSTSSSKDYKIMGILIVVAAVVLLGLKTSGFDMEARLTNASYAVLFVVGILTSIHCVGMCGGIMLSQSLSKESQNKFQAIQPSILYNIGRVLSYTILGGIIGAVGSVFSLSITAQAGVQVFAGIFMIIMGLNMAGFKLFRKFQIKLPSFACRTKNKSGSPFIVGILNGFMPCGPLQTMQLFALATGSATKGALAMFVFSIGTVPLMLTFGALSGLLSKGYTKKILKFSGILIIVLGLIMGNRGLALAGLNINPVTTLSSFSSSIRGNSNITIATLEEDIQIINMTANNSGYTPNAFYVQKGIPVKWIINGEQINSCNNAIVARELNLEKKISSGENIIEFTPGEKDINFSCWMGMIRGVIKVVDDLDTVDIATPDPSIPPASEGPSCCATPIEDSAADIGPSIYGDDISKVATDVLINTSIDKTLEFKGTGYELQPLIGVTSKDEKVKLVFNINDFDNSDSEFLILDSFTGEALFSFPANNGITEIDIEPNSTGSYIILKDNAILGIIEVVDDVNTTDMEVLREQYIR
ncbi:heavy metal transport/detoxification protein [Alkalibaculum sp. M08DMB]|uniref:Heavy metal transport/detoxification protein n=1 Tax=Alkalibaculum sporogenes TaxID=2655001 RepID=A0A6A7K606_9FIRM|nr:sulfite exporter TauE/SafE family protein [Alkalibaculum sporogenes]MPW24583.1 heavy metal transport/detoxification protein [Alkalibaculum sporogenes]